MAALGVALLIPLSAPAAQPFPDPAVDASLSASKGSETAVLAGGCFWGVEAVFDHLKGVKSVVAGFSEIASTRAGMDCSDSTSCAAPMATWFASAAAKSAS